MRSPCLCIILRLDDGFVFVFLDCSLCCWLSASRTAPGGPGRGRRRRGCGLRYHGAGPGAPARAGVAVAGRPGIVPCERQLGRLMESHGSSWALKSVGRIGLEIGLASFHWMKPPEIGRNLSSTARNDPDLHPAKPHGIPRGGSRRTGKTGR